MDRFEFRVSGRGVEMGRTNAGLVDPVPGQEVSVRRLGDTPPKFRKPGSETGGAGHLGNAPPKPETLNIPDVFPLQACLGPASPATGTEPRSCLL